jgi:putative ABC transport system permease protein
MKEFKDEPARQIIGIVGDVRDGGLNRDPHPHMYVPQAQLPDAENAWTARMTPIAWLVRAQVPPCSLTGAVQEQLRQVTGLPVSGIRFIGDVLEQSTSRQRFNMLLMTVRTFHLRNSRWRRSWLSSLLR